MAQNGLCHPQIMRGLINLGGKIVAYELLDLKSSAAYAAPELMGFWWRETAEFLNENVTDFSQDWHNKVFKIFTGKD